MSIDDLFSEPLKITSAGIILYVLSSQVNSEEPGAQALSEFGNGLTIAQENEALKADLARLEAGWQPSCADLAGTPELQDWGILDTGEALLKVLGDVDEPSKIGASVSKRKRVATSYILARDTALTWIRDRRGFYRLDEAHSLVST
ncbi:hypothetical protein ACQKLX_21140 [Bosea sp. NPDC003192]|uniref:hypothetical protein n=1 Tax=Bosea sp. NPDC003192 TaxID=3390551 RepID=UPI003D06FB4C